MTANGGPVEVAVVGGGLVGAALAYGLARRGRSILLLDEGDVALRASRGNFGLVWVQGKGRGLPAYALWSQRSARLWAELAAQLREDTAIDVGHSQRGGALIAMSEEELAGFGEMLAEISEAVGPENYEHELLDHDGLAKLIPGLGPDVPGGSFTPYDGHVNPLRLLRALHAGFQTAGGDYRPRARLAHIEAVEGGFELRSQAGTFEAGKLVIAAGLATPDLARQVAVEAPIHPVHGQLLITERAAPRLAIPTNIVRQTDEGGFQIGYSNDELGYVTGTRLGVLRDIAHNAVRALPYLAGLRILRTWGALRIMTPDGFPIYARSTEHPGAFVFACHSGVTLAAVHAMICPGWIDGDGIPEEQACFSPERFDVQTTA